MRRFIERANERIDHLTIPEIVVFVTIAATALYFMLSALLRSS